MFMDPPVMLRLSMIQVFRFHGSVSLGFITTLLLLMTSPGMSLKSAGRATYTPSLLLPCVRRNIQTSIEFFTLHVCMSFAKAPACAFILCSL